MEPAPVFLNHLAQHRNLDVKVPDWLNLEHLQVISKNKKIKKAESDPTITYGDQNVGIPFNQRKSCTTKEKKILTTGKSGPILIGCTWPKKEKHFATYVLDNIRLQHEWLYFGIIICFIYSS